MVVLYDKVYYQAVSESYSKKFFKRIIEMYNRKKMFYFKTAFKEA